MAAEFPFLVKAIDKGSRKNRQQGKSVGLVLNPFYDGRSSTEIAEVVILMKEVMSEFVCQRECPLDVIQSVVKEDEWAISKITQAREDGKVQHKDIQPLLGCDILQIRKSL